MHYFHTADDCFNNPVGVAHETIIPDDAFFASSQKSGNTKAEYGRLHHTKKDGWCAESRDSNEERIGVDLGKRFKICGLATQGSASNNAWVTKFKVRYSPNQNSNLKTFRGADDSPIVSTVGLLHLLVLSDATTFSFHGIQTFGKLFIAEHIILYPFLQSIQTVC